MKTQIKRSQFQQRALACLVPLLSLAVVGAQAQPQTAPKAPPPKAKATVTVNNMPGTPAPPMPVPVTTAPGTSPMPTMAEETVQDMALFVGEARTIPLSGVTRVAVGNGALITATVLDGREVLLLGEAAGDTSLFIWSNGVVKKYRVKINASDTNVLVRNVRQLISDLPGIKMDVVGDQVVLSGAASKTDLKRIELVANNYKQVVNLVREEEVTLKKMVYIKVQFMEFRRNALENLGIQWATSMNGPAAAITGDVLTNSQFRVPSTAPAFQPGVGSNAPLSISSQPWRIYLGLASTISSTINLAMSNGDAGMLASPELATRSGGEAKFLAGGQVPLPVTSPTGQVSVTFKDYGIKLNINPVVDDNNNIQAKLDTEVSAIDASVVVQGIPGFTVRSTSSDINLKSGQTVVLSGLVNETMANAVDKFPWLGDVPVMGALFRSTNFTAGRTDLVVFVTPIVIDPNSTANQQRLDKAKAMRERFEGTLGKKGIVD
ncbi:type II and III secretion system protein family protein [Variovorax sp. VNK109]|uniref:type II and III secretion system protein family protein n=1 Tax=Variovorax sp. VNK109 TaxID=3400919 RepID=UPI003C066008